MGPRYFLHKIPVTVVNINFITLLRFKVKGDLVTQLTFPLFFELQAQRLSVRAKFYGSPAELPDFIPLLA